MVHGKIATIILWQSLLFGDGAIIPMTNREGKLSLVEWTNYNYHEPEGYGTYAFGYDIEDPDNNNVQFRNEEKLSNGSVVGSYGYLEETGNAFVVRYIADQRGYRATVENPVNLSFLKPIRTSDGLKTPNRNNSNPNKGITNINMTDSGDTTESSEVPPDLNPRPIPPEKNTDETTSNGNTTPQPGSVKDSNSFYYPENILESPDFHKDKDKPKETKPSQNSHTDLDFNSEEERNAFYYPQNILASPDFHKKEDNDDKITFQKKLQQMHSRNSSFHENNSESHMFSSSESSMTDESFYYDYPENILGTSNRDTNEINKKLQEQNGGDLGENIGNGSFFERNNQSNQAQSSSKPEKNYSFNTTKTQEYNFKADFNHTFNFEEKSSTQFRNDLKLNRMKIEQKDEKINPFVINKMNNRDGPGLTSFDDSVNDNPFKELKRIYQEKTSIKQDAEVGKQFGAKIRNDRLQRPGIVPRIYTPDKTYLPSPSQQSQPCVTTTTVESEPNSFYYPQNIIQSIDFNNNRQVKDNSKKRTRIVTPDENINNNNYFPQSSYIQTSQPCN